MTTRIFAVSILIFFVFSCRSTQNASNLLSQNQELLNLAKNPDAWFLERGIPKSYTNTKDKEKLQELITRMIENPPSTYDLDDDAEPFLKFAAKTLDSPTQSTVDSSANFLIAKRIVFTALTMDVELPKNLSTGVDMSLNVALLGRNMTVRRQSRNQVEAKFLAEKNNPQTQFMNAPKSIDAKRLTIGPSHPAFRQRRVESRDVWSELENKVEISVQKKIPGYRIKEARRVLFFTKLKSGATSPKLSSEDRYGIKWKVKWGDEVAVEPVTNRLYLEAGGHHTDLVYANGVGQEHLVLVLPKTGADQKGCQITNLKSLTRCFRDSGYEFNIAPYVYESGVLDQSNMNRILGYADPELVGHHWVTFRESSVEMKIPKSVVRRGGGTSFSGLGALEDRVARSLLVFNMWIWNKDAKDDNNVSALVDFKGEKERYVEYQHDFGAALGGELSSGMINKLGTKIETGICSPARSTFICLNRNGDVRFRQGTLYVPKAWKQITFADAHWMAQRIAQISNAQILRAVEGSNWPWFNKIRLAHKLSVRRNAIAKVFDVQNYHPIIKLSATHMSDLSKELRVGLDRVDAFAKALAAKLVRENGTSPNLNPKLVTEIANSISNDIQKASSGYGLTGIWGKKKKNRWQTIVDSEGNMESCDKSVLIGTLNTYLHPSGINGRIPRNLDNISMKERTCSYGVAFPIKDRLTYLVKETIGNLIKQKMAPLTEGRLFHRDDD